MAKRTLTLLIEFDEHFSPSWIWQSHKDNRFIQGVLVKCICEGDQIASLDTEHGGDE